MSRVKQLSRNAVFAWGPRGAVGPGETWLAAGTSAGHFDASFSSSAALELCRLELAEGGAELSPARSVPVSQRFHSLLWSEWGVGEGGRPRGVLVGGQESGAIGLWDAQKLLEGGGAELASLKGHSSHVLSMETNPFKRNLLGSGASGSEVLVWDLGRPDAAPMAPGPKQQPADQVVAVRWSPQVEHILGSLSTGRAAVWDLRKSEGPILTLGELGARVQWRAMAWHPQSATSLVLASEEDSYPVLQSWDVRFAQAPLAQMDGHAKGILALDWHPQDPDLLLTAAKDMKLYLWNPNTATFLAEVPFSARNWPSQVSWCPTNPNLMGVGSADGRVGVYSLLGGGGGAETSQGSPMPSPGLAESFPGADFSSLPQPSPEALAKASEAQRSAAQALHLPQVPRWLRPGPCGARFGFGNRLLTFSLPPPTDPAALQPGQPAPLLPRAVELKQVVTDEALVRRAAELDASLGQREGVAELCAARRDAEGLAEEERLLWDFLRAHSQGAGRREYAKALGIPDVDQPALAQALGPRQDWQLPPQDDPSQASVSRSISADPDQLAQSDEAASDDNADELCASLSSLASLSEGAVGESPLSVAAGAESWEGLVTRAVLAGDLDAAAEACVRSGQWADAFQLAMAGGADLFRRLQTAYVRDAERAGRQTSRLVGLLTGQRWPALIRSVELAHWRELLGLLLSFAPSEDFAGLAGQLAERMRSEAKAAPFAPLAAVAAGNAEALVGCLHRPGLSSAQLLDMVEKVSVLRWSLGGGAPRSVPAGPDFAAACAAYARLLVAQGALAAAAAFLAEVPDDAADQDLALLRDRVSEATGAGRQQGRRPSRPFQITPIGQQQRSNGYGQTGRAAVGASGPGDWRRGSTQAAGFGQSFGGSGSSAFSNSSRASAPAQPHYAMPQQPAAPAPPPMGPPPTGPPSLAGSAGGNRSRYPSQSIPDAPSTPSYNTGFQPAQSPWGAAPSPGYGQPPAQMMMPQGGAEASRAPSGPPVAAVAPRPNANFTPGWNDPPPSLGPSKKKAAAAQTPAQPPPAPVTMPVLGGVPPERHAHGPPPTAQSLVGAPPPPISFNTSMASHQAQTAHAPQTRGGYPAPPGGPGGYPPQGPLQGYPPQGYPPQGHPPQGHPPQGHPPQGHPPQGHPQGPGGQGWAPSAASSARASPVPSLAAEAEEEPAMPAEDAVIEETLVGLVGRMSSAEGALVRKRVGEAGGRLERELFRRLRRGQLSEGVRAALRQASQAAAQGHYDHALHCANALATGTEFAAVSPFLPALKATLQTAKQLRIAP